MIKAYNFDEITDRSGSGDLRHEALLPRWGRNDLLPLWVADMDFACPNFVVEALKDRLSHPILGYTVEPEDFRPAIIDWIRAHHDWRVKPKQLSFIPGIVRGIGFMVNVSTELDEKVIIQPPVYHPFRLTPEANHREAVFNPLRRREGGYYDMDFDNLAEVCDNKCRVLVLSNPRNPAGLYWSEDILRRLTGFCYEHNITAVSDEIRSDMTPFGNRHIPFASVLEHAAQISITSAAPTKTFDMADVVSSSTIIPSEELHNRFYGWLKANELDEPTLFAPTATIAAHRKGEEWCKQMLTYVEENIRFVEDFCCEYIPGIHPLRPQANFLVWPDCHGLGLKHRKLPNLFIDKAHLALNDGRMFGIGGEGFMRLNAGTSRSILRQASEQLVEAMNGL